MRLQLLGGLTAGGFLERHWQKKPLLVRSAIPGFRGTAELRQLFQLAANQDVESRLVRGTGLRRSLEHGPFSASRLRALPERNWTLLVQGVNLHDPGADALLHLFRFIPYARLDDVMVSYAVPGGGVGPHVDSYDVFLLQGMGRRQWRIGRCRNAELVEGSPLRLLRAFEPEEEYLLEPGDMLYLPPGWAHDGIALDACTTYSIGFRAPAIAELMSQLLLRTSEHMQQPGLYRDPGLRTQASPSAIPSDMIAKTLASAAKLRFGREAVRDFLGEYLSEPKPTVVFSRPPRALPLGLFCERASAVGIRLDARTLMLHSDDRFFINGESLTPPARLARALLKLADERHLPAAAHARLWPLLYDWYCAGWLHLQSKDRA